MKGIAETISDFISDKLDAESFYSVKGIVSDVDENEGTCNVTPVNGDPIIRRVFFKPKYDETEGIFITPNDKSHVVITFLNNEQAFVSLCQDYSKVTIRQGSVSIVMDDNEVVINSGNETGVRAQSLESKLNALITELNTHVHQDSTGNPTLAPTTPMSTFDKGDFESPKLKL